MRLPAKRATRTCMALWNNLRSGCNWLLRRCRSVHRQGLTFQKCFSQDRSSQGPEMTNFHLRLRRARVNEEAGRFYGYTMESRLGVRQIGACDWVFFHVAPNLEKRSFQSDNYESVETSRAPTYIWSEASMAIWGTKSGLVGDVGHGFSV